LGYPLNLSSATDKINDLSFVTAIGLVKWGATLHSGGRQKGRKSKSVEQVSGRVKDWFKALIP